MDIKNLMRQAQEMQKKMQKVQEDLANSVYEAESGGGMVKVTISGDGNVKNINIDPSLLKEDEKEIVEDLLVAALNQAKKKADDESANSMKNAAGGISLPSGFKF